jgi:dTDP-4-dehydrorhamnose 3,5-epimerase
MEEQNILIIGTNGQLGRALKEKYPKAQAVDSEQLDITNTSALQDFDWNNIKVILNAAAYTNVDGAETPEGRKMAWRINAEGVANLVSIATQKDLTLVHISTDYVFDGTKEKHTEDEPYSPISVYGASKAAGDITVSLAPKFYILRTSWVIGEGKNFVRTMLELAKKDISPTVVADQIGRLTFTSELVKAIDHLLTHDAPYGTYNVTNSGDPVSWAEITRTIFSEAGYSNLNVTNITTNEYFMGKDNVAPRPLQSTLDITKIQSTGFTSTDWYDDLNSYIEKETSK